jgi:chromosome segregation ATPase
MRRWLDEADKIAKTADKIGLTTEALQSLRFAGGLTGQTIEQTDKSLEQFVKRLGEAAQGTGPLAKELSQLGISVRDANGNLRSTEAVMNDYADAIQNAASPQERLRLAVAAFGKSGAGMVNALRNGSKGLTELKKEAGAAGGVLEDRLLRVAERLNDNFSRLTTKVGSGFKRAFLEIADFTGLAGGMSQLERRTAELRNTLEASEKQAAAFRSEIERLQAIGDASLTPAIEQLQKALAGAEAQGKSLRDEIAGIGATAATEGGAAVKGIDALRASLQSASDETKGLYTETQKLFAQPEYDPFANMPGQAAKATAAWQLVGDAASAVRRGDADADQAVERAALALNRLKDSGAASEYELQQLKDTLAGVLEDIGTAEPPPIKISLDKDGLFSATDQATEEAMARAKTLIIKADLDTTLADRKLVELQARAALIGRSATAESQQTEAKTGGRP